MRLVRKSIIRKLFVNLLLFSLLIAAIAFYFFYTDQQMIPFYVFLGALGLFLVYFLIAYWWDIVRPLRVVLEQMQLLIAGKQYKRIYTARIDEVGIIAHFFNQVTAGLGEVSHDIKDRERLLEELNVASQLQRDILPLKSPPVKGLQIVAKTRPATELGGDSFNFLKTKDLTYIYIGDVTGHGVAAGLIMTMVNSLMNVFVDFYSSPYEVLVMINKYIKKHVKKTMFMTMVLLSWDEKNQQLRYVGAGHEHILVYRAETGVCDVILSGGVALGMVPDNSKVIKEEVLDLKNGDFVILYTDGIIESRNVNGEMFGLERLRHLVVDYAPQYSADGINYHIAMDVSAFARGHVQDDDMTLIVIKRDDAFTGEDNQVVQVTNWDSK